jgi:HK97 family phage major capsid protein
MTLAQMLAAARATVAEIQARLTAAGQRADTAAAAARALLTGAQAAGRSSMDAAETAQFDQQTAARSTAITEQSAIQTELTAANARVTELDRMVREDEAAEMASRTANPTPAGAPAPRQRGGAVVVAEPRTYMAELSRRGERSFFSDAYMANQRGDVSAQQRLQRHHQEMVVDGVVSARAQTTTTFAGLIVPQYLVELVALLVRAGRPFANSVLRMPLPTEGMSFVVPRGTTGAAAASQATENAAVQNTDEVWANLTVAVNTIAGQQDVSRQSLERGTPGIDELVFLDLSGAYHAELDRQCLNGSGASNQMLGAFQTAGIGAATLFGAAPTFTTFNSKLAGQIAGIAGTGVGIVPQLIAMHPRRWGWLSSLVDTAGRPIIEPLANGVFNAGALNLNPGGYGGAPGVDNTDTIRIVGSMQGLPVFTDANVPTAVGTESEDLVGVYDPSKIILWEDGDGQPTQLRFEQTLGNQLTVKVVLYGYAAFSAGRYPPAFGKIGGLDTGGATFGLVAPTF